MPEPVFSIDLKGNLELANPAARELFFLNEEKVRHKTAGSLLGGYNFARWFDGGETAPHTERVLINNQDYLMEITPIQLEDENQQSQTVGAVVMLKSTARMGKQLQIQL